MREKLQWAIQRFQLVGGGERQHDVSCQRTEGICVRGVRQHHKVADLTIDYRTARRLESSIVNTRAPCPLPQQRPSPPPPFQATRPAPSSAPQPRTEPRTARRSNAARRRSRSWLLHQRAGRASSPSSRGCASCSGTRSGSSACVTACGRRSESGSRRCERFVGTLYDRCFVALRERCYVGRG